MLYAASPGAFVDLAADLSYTLAIETATLILDGHLATPDVQQGTTGLDTQVAINQAIGVLIGRGHTLETAETSCTDSPALIPAICTRRPRRSSSPPAPTRATPPDYLRCRVRRVTGHKVARHVAVDGDRWTRPATSATRPRIPIRAGSSVDDLTIDLAAATRAAVTDGFTVIAVKVAATVAPRDG